METSGGWQPGPGGAGSPGEVPGDWPGATVWTYPGAGIHRRGSVVRFLMWSALAGLAGVVGLITLAALLIPHTILLIILVLLALPVLLVAMATGVLIWVGRRAWRSGAWLEAVPMAAGMPWMSRLVWALRALLVGRAFRRLGQRTRRPRGSSRRYGPGGYAEYQTDPGGPWHQARAGDLSGTTR